MRWLKFVWRNATRSRRRTILTVLSLAATFFLFCTLQTALTSWDKQSSFHSAEHRVVTQHKVSLFSFLPEKYLGEIAALPGVEAVSGMHWFGGHYKDPDDFNNFFSQFAVDTKPTRRVSGGDVLGPPAVFDVYPSLDVPADQREAFLADRSGCIVHESLLQKFEKDGWKIGFEIPLEGTGFPVDPRLTIRGVYTDKVWKDSLMFHREYLEEALGNPGIEGWFVARCASAAAMDRVIDSIDRRYENSEFPTRSMSEQAFNESFTAMLGGVQQFARNLSIVLLVVIVLAAGNAIALSARERVHEIAVLRAVGFTPARVRWLLLAEAVLLSLLGGTVGSLGAWAIWHGSPPPMFAIFEVEPRTVVMGIALSLVVGAVAGALPARRAASLPIVQGLRKVA